MQTFLHTKFEAHLSKFLYTNTNSLIAISGGQDSLCLVKLIQDCFIQTKNFYFEAIYIDHQWKEDSFNHSKHLANIFQTTSIPITVYQIKSFAFSEAEARELRYKILIQHALRNNLRNIITGHNMNDQTETFLQKLIRGSSLNGITSLRQNKKITQNLCIIRPLVNYNKEEIKWFCQKFCLPIWSDNSNYNYKVQRNRLRHEIIPYLQRYFNPQLHVSINSFLYLCHNDNEYIKENSIKLYIKSKHSKLIGLNLRILNKQHFSLQIRIIQIYFYHHFNISIHITNLLKIIKVINQADIKNYILYLDTIIVQKLNGWLYANLIKN